MTTTSSSYDTASHDGYNNRIGFCCFWLLTDVISGQHVSKEVVGAVGVGADGAVSYYVLTRQCVEIDVKFRYFGKNQISRV